MIGHQSSSQEVGEQSYELRRSTRVRKAKTLRSDEIDSHNISFYLIEGTNESVLKIIPLVLQVKDDPKMFKEAMASHDAAFWKYAINDEMNFIMSNHT